MYVCKISLTRICRALVPEIRIHSEMLRLFLHIDVVHVCDCQLKTHEQHLQGPHV